MALLLVGSVGLAGCVSHSQARLPESRPSGGTLSQPNTHGPTYTVVARTLAVTYKLQGTSATSAHVGVMLADNTRFVSTVRTGLQVSPGQRIGRMSPDPRVVESLSAAARSSTVARSQLLALERRVGSVAAPLGGRLRLGADGPVIDSSGLDAVVPITPLQELRYRSLSFGGTVTLETVFGLRTAPCVAVWLEQVSGQATDVAGMGPASAELHCRVPADVESAAGLPLTVTLKARPMPHVIAIPAIYVGLDGAGKNYVVKVRDGVRWVERPVVVGPSDGVVRVVVSGVSAGDVLTPVTGS